MIQGVCCHMELSLYLHIYYSYILYVYITFIGINHTMIMVSYESERRDISDLLRCNCCWICWIYVTQNSSDATAVESMALSSSLVNYNHSFLLSKLIKRFYYYYTPCIWREFTRINYPIKPITSSPRDMPHRWAISRDLLQNRLLWVWNNMVWSIIVCQGLYMDCDRVGYQHIHLHCGEGGEVITCLVNGTMHPYWEILNYMKNFHRGIK